MIVLDTNAWLAWTSWPSRLSPKGARAIVDHELNNGLIVVSAISVWEIAVKAALGKLILDRDVKAWIRFAAAYSNVVMMPLDPVDALESTLLPGEFHKDPADRMIIALARRLECPLITGDHAIRAYRYVKTIW